MISYFLEPLDTQLFLARILHCEIYQEFYESWKWQFQQISSCFMTKQLEIVKMCRMLGEYKAKLIHSYIHLRVKLTSIV